MRPVIKHEMFVNLVGHDNEIMLLRDFGNQYQFVTREDLAGWVVRRVEQDEFGTR